METEIKKLVKEISSWCVDNHSEEFMCDFHLTGHVSWVEVILASGGYGNGGEEFRPEFTSLTSEEWSLKWLIKLLEEMKEFKAWHDEEFKPENVARHLLAKKKARAKRLRTELNSLEIELHQPSDILSTLNTEENE